MVIYIILIYFILKTGIKVNTSIALSHITKKQYFEHFENLFIMKKQKNAINPYLTTLQVPTMKRTRKDAFVINAEGQREPDTYLVDKSPYYRGFKSEANNDIYGKLSPVAHKMLNYCQNRSPVKNSYLFIRPSKYMEWAEIKSLTTVRTTISELIIFNIIQRHEGKKNCYWYNPNYFNTGSRLTKYKNNLAF